MIKIITKGGKVFTWDKNKYEYRYDEKAILIFKDGEIVALYNMDVVASVFVE